MKRWAKKYPGGASDRFFSKVDKDGPVVREGLGQCWLWTGTTTGPDGHGTFWDGGKIILAHRFSLETHKGQPITEGLNALHHCDVGLCVRPDHLYEGTQSDNLRDAYSRNRRDGASQSRLLLAARMEKLGY